MSRTLIVSSPFYTPSGESILITDQNWKSFTQADSNFHTSLGDISSQNLLSFCEYIDQVEFVNYKFESIPDTLAITKILLNSLTHCVTVNNYKAGPPDTFLSHDMIRPDADRVVWVFGCSYSHGIGVDHDQSYVHWVTQDLGLPVVLVTKPGGSTRWGLRHLLHANIQPQDMIIWQISTFMRDSIKDTVDSDPTEIVYDDNNLHKFKLLSFEQMLFNHFSLVDYGVQYLRAKNHNFYLISADNRNIWSEYGNRCLLEFTKYPEYCYTPDCFVDFGSDGRHAGPESHKLIAEHLLRKIQNDRC